MTETMRAVVIDEPGPPEVLQIRELPIPQAEAGQVLIRVKAFGLNRSELHFRTGVATSGTFPRVPGIEATGVVAAAPGGEFTPGEQVVTMMGGMGRVFDGGYAEYVVVPAGQVKAFRSDLRWEQLGAVPEMLQTAYGSLTVGVRAESYFAIAEALANMGRHRHAKSAWVTMRHVDGRLVVEVGDDGVGGAQAARGTGLQGIARRLNAFDGTMTVSSPPGGPTVLTMELPCALSSPRT